jgi:uncharacterized protein
MFATYSLYLIAICNAAAGGMIFLLLEKRRTSGNYLTVATKPMRPAHFLRVFTLLSVAFLGAVRAYPEDIKNVHPTGYVTDLAGIISAEKKESLEALCTEVEQKTSAQMAIVTVQSLENESVEQCAVDLFKQLGVGEKKDKRGVLLLLAPNQRKYRIEVGYGLEPVINDARAGGAGRAMVPFLRQNDFGKAAEVGAWQLAKYIADDAGVTLSGQRPAVRNPDQGGNFKFPVGLLLIALFVLFRVISSFSTGRGGRGFGGGSGLLWFLLGMLSSSGGRSSGGGGSWSGGGFGGSGGGFGGFGGGSSGGGGASGSW